MTDKLQRPTSPRRSSCFQIGNVLAMPVLLGGVRAHADGGTGACHAEARRAKRRERRRGR